MYIQNYIGQIFYNINYKINNNNKIIGNLEELSQTLFKRWFVDFEFLMKTEIHTSLVVEK